MRLHHIGFLTDNLDRSASVFCETCGYARVSEIVEDLVQTARVLFLKREGDGELLELVSPNGENSKLSLALKKGVSWHHLCYETADIEAELRRFRENGFLVLCEPVPAPAFDGRRIAWVMNADKALIELVERA